MIQKMKSGFNTRYSNGFSLVEVMVALLIFASSLLLIFSMLPVAYSCMGKARNIHLATELAHKQVEFVKSLDWEALYNENPALANQSVTLVSWVNGATTSVKFDTDTVVSTVSTDPETGTPNCRLVTIQVKYGTGNSQEVGMLMETMIYIPTADDLDDIDEIIDTQVYNGQSYSY